MHVAKVKGTWGLELEFSKLVALHLSLKVQIGDVGNAETFGRRALKI